MALIYFAKELIRRCLGYDAINVKSNSVSEVVGDNAGPTPDPRVRAQVEACLGPVLRAPAWWRNLASAMAYNRLIRHGLAPPQRSFRVMFGTSRGPVHSDIYMYMLYW